ncbi:MAG: peptidoglycan-binding domain-containing protein [Alphaproteobacteria bacterium]|nr:peptidoglycan-binding domain-containing protein [Alphaproteobacteria bacterium]
MGRCVAGLPNPPWSKIYADVRQKYLNEQRTRTSKRVPQRRKAARSYIPLNSKRTIRSIQSRLSKLGYRPGPIDGKMGRRTRAAIKSYQRRHRLSVTGRPNRQLLAALKITSSARPSSSSRARANPPRSSRRSSSAGRTKRRTATSSAIDASFATHCLRADRTNSYYNSCGFPVTERTIAKAPGGWHVMVGQTIKPGRRGGLLVESYKGRYHYMGCRTSDVRSNRNNRCVQVWFCLHKLYKQRVMMRSAGSLLGRCGVSLAVTKGR